MGTVPIVERRCATRPRASKANQRKLCCRKFGCKSNAVFRLELEQWVSLLLAPSPRFRHCPRNRLNCRNCRYRRCSRLFLPCPSPRRCLRCSQSSPTAPATPALTAIAVPATAPTTPAPPSAPATPAAPAAITVNSAPFGSCSCC
jgi:hypothetical protein